MTGPLLSICIPTYGRAEYLRDALESIRVQIAEDPELAERVEIVVADNASKDHTARVVAEYAACFPHFVSVHNQENVGFDRNVDIVVRAAHGEYCWYLGDDDAIIPGALAHMVEVCETGEYTVISMLDRPLTDRPLGQLRTETYARTAHIDDLTPSESYIRGHLPSALSMLAFRHELWLACADLADHTPGWFYFETILKMAVRPDARILHINAPMILTGQDMRWADGGAGLKIFIDCNRFLRKMIEWGYDRATIERELADNVRRFPHVLLQAKAKGLAVSEANRSLVRSFTAHAPLPTRLLSFLLFSIPNPVVRIVRDLKKRFL